MLAMFRSSSPPPPWSERLDVIRTEEMPKRDASMPKWMGVDKHAKCVIRGSSAEVP